MEIWEAVARESIRDVAIRYNANGDTGRFEQLMELFAADAVMELGGEDGNAPRLYRGHEEILTIFTGARTRWSGESTATAAVDQTVKHHIRHHLATQQIDLDDPTHARGYAYFQVLMPHGLDHWGRYRDRYEERDGRWQFVYRKVTVDGHSQPE